jgi:GT2 family glycosyltransferase
MVFCENIWSNCIPKLIVGNHPPHTDYDADIIILTRNRFLDTVDAVNSALRQTNVRRHVSLFDQGSDPRIQTEFAEAFMNHRNFGFYAIDRNFGVGGGRNFLSSLGSSPVIVALDNDATFANDLVVAKAVIAFAENPALGILGFKILAQDGTHLDEFSWGYPARLKKYSDTEFVATTFVGAGHAIRRTTWCAVGGYDADLFFTWEEYDLSLRAIALGWLIKCNGALAVIHKISPEARVQWSSERTRLYIRNRLTLARKWKISWLSLAPRISVYLIKAARNRRLMPALAGLIAAIVQDRSLVKRSMNPHMIFYVNRNETRYHENPFAYFYHHILIKMRPDILTSAASETVRRGPSKRR